MKILHNGEEITSDKAISTDKVYFKCQGCDTEVVSNYSNYKNRKHFLCISCTRKKTVSEVHKNRSKEERKKINKKISQKTKLAMKNIPTDKRQEMTKKMVSSIDWEKRNKQWQETMLNKTQEEKKEIYNKVSTSLKQRYKNQGPWNLTRKYPSTRYSTIDCKYYKRGLHSSNETIRIKCDNCGQEFETIRMAAARQEREHPGYIQCSTCVSTSRSLKEIEIVNYIKSLGVNNIIRNSKSIIAPQEIDIYLPDYNLAIEYNGLYWHSEQQGLDKKYHLNKTKVCKEKGIHLIHLFQDDWSFKQDIVKSRLRNILGKNENRIGARKTVIKEIDSKTKNKFLIENHIQGKDKAQIKLGAFYNKELVSVMTFSKNRFINNNMWELSRFATIPNTQTPGLASKMLKHFENNYDWQAIFSFADRCWSIGNLYYQLGFEFEKETTPSYWYAFSGTSKREHRYNYRKQNLTKFENYSDNKTEKEIMDEAGYLRIYDCGTLKFIKKREA